MIIATNHKILDFITYDFLPIVGAVLAVLFVILILIGIVLSIHYIFKK